MLERPCDHSSPSLGIEAQRGAPVVTVPVVVGRSAREVEQEIVRRLDGTRFEHAAPRGRQQVGRVWPPRVDPREKGIPSKRVEPAFHQARQEKCLVHLGRTVEARDA